MLLLNNKKSIFTNIHTPSNRKFGCFFTIVFMVGATYFFWVDNIYIACLCAIISLALGIITAVNNKILLPLNRLWMGFGMLLSMIVSPIVLGLLFFLLFTPIALIMRLANRDELKLKKFRYQSLWVNCNSGESPKHFYKQF